MSALEKKLQVMKTLFPRLSSHDLISALPRISAYPLLHKGLRFKGSHTQGSISDVYIDRCSLHSGVQINVSYMTGP